jgi:hypothetical protein
MTRPQEYILTDLMSNGIHGNGFLKRVPAPPVPSRTPAFPIYDNLVDREFLAPVAAAPPPGNLFKCFRRLWGTGFLPHDILPQGLISRDISLPR